MRDLRKIAKQRVGGVIKGKWTLDALLGVGGMASVYAATHRNGSRAALKILHTDLATDEGLRARFIREGYVANKADHPGRVAVLDDDMTEQGAPFLVMELLEGETLQQRAKREKKLEPAEALRVAADVLDTLQPFHDVTIVHRDLKPSNIFITHDDVVKLLDFGIAQLREAGTEATMAGTALGTPWFMAPEQAQARQQLDGRADIFAVGAVLYTILSGKRLWEVRNETQAFVMAATQPAPSLARAAPDLPVEIIAAVDKALQWDARNRFQSAAEMRDVLRGIRDKLTAGQDAADGQPAAPAARASVPPAAPARPVHPARAQVQIKSVPAAPQSIPPVRRADSIRPVPKMPSIPPPASLRPGADYQKPGVDPEAAKLSEVFRRLDRLLKAIRHYGMSHPETGAKVHGLHEAMISVLRLDPEGLSWETQPYCFTRGGEPVYEPDPPADVIPYNLYVSGVKGIAVQPGVTEEELHTFCYIITLDPTQDIGGGVDIAGALWEAGLTNIVCDIGESLGAFDAAEEESFWAEADDVEALARDDLEGSENEDVATDIARAAAAAMVLDPMEMLAREDVAEAAAMALAQGGGSASLGPAADALKLDRSAALAIKAEIGQPTDRWRERFLDLTIDALADAAWRGDESKVWASFGAYARRLARTGDLDELFATYGALRERLYAYKQEQVFAASLPGITVQIWNGHVFDVLVNCAAGLDVDLSGTAKAEEDAIREQAKKTLSAVLELLDASACPDALALLRTLPKGDAYDQLISYVERHVAGNESYFRDQLERLDVELAHHVMGLLAKTGTQAGVDALQGMLHSSNPVLRCEAMALLAESPDTLKDQLLGMIESLDESVRNAALATMARHQVKAAGPGLVRAIEDESFWTRGAERQRRLFDALFQLHPRRGEEIATTIVKKHGLMKDDDLERTRTMVAELLGKYGETPQALEGLQEATARRWWNSPGLRAVAAKSAHAVNQRMSERKASGTEAPE
jgi:serine/threonine protein kinase